MLMESQPRCISDVYLPTADEHGAPMPVPCAAIADVCCHSVVDKRTGKRVFDGHQRHAHAYRLFFAGHGPNHDRQQRDPILLRKSALHGHGGWLCIQISVESDFGKQTTLAAHTGYPLTKSLSSSHETSRRWVCFCLLKYEILCSKAFMQVLRWRALLSACN